MVDDNPGEAASGRPPNTAGLAARRLAALCLRDSLRERRFLEDVEADRAAAFAALSGPDRGFARALARAAFRSLGEIDGVLAERIQKPLPASATDVTAHLRIALAQILTMEVAPHAAVDAAVRLTKETRPKLAGLTNAVLRGVLRAPPAPLDAAARARVNTPSWLWRALKADWGGATEAIARGHALPAPLDLTLARAETARPDGAPTPSGSWRVAEGGDVAQMPGFDGGGWWVQDAAAALPARLLRPGPCDRILDLCAAPGGKTLQLAAAGARVTALDLSAPRLERLRENLARTRLEAVALCGDALDAATAPGPFDAVLLDAPCSATGTIRRHPELPHIKSLEGAPDLMARQDALLDAAWARLAVGGRLVYCVCSLLRREGESRVKAFLARTPDALRDPIAAAEVGDPALLSPDGALRTAPHLWPEIGGLDGFYAARLVKKAP